ncbi:MAG TPA: MurT ligase domain-containing protein [Ktedonobacteraceae bacterium]|nr:MurT ligase domain-containing protein [Ktedonobacteraceae bacterium]
MPKQKLPRLVSRERRSGKSNRPQKQKEKASASENSPLTPTGTQPASQHTSLRAGFAVMGGRTMGALSRRLHLGGGTSVVGIVAQRLYPDIVGHLAAQLEHGSIIVTGTNGKTTTSGLIAAIFSDAGLRVWRNREGSNLMRGVASSLVIRALPNGNLRRSGAAISIFEVDEAVIPQMVSTIVPRVAVFTNLFRDQLDRYGEMDSVTARWLQAVKALPTSTTLVLNADDPTTASLGELFAGNVLYFGIDDPALDLQFQQTPSERHQVIDTRTCPKCGTEYTYELRFYSHMGHYACTNCGHKRPQADVRVTKVQSDDFDRLRIHVVTEKQEGDIVIPLPGLYNIYNVLAAITTAQVLNTDWEPIVTGIEQFKPMFGRGERVQIEGRTLRLLLAKNPTGFNEVLRTLFNEETPRHVLFILNDNIADGRDISWIWDVDFERVVHQTATLVVGGTRALDLALRLKYAGIAQEEMTIVPATPLRAARREKVAHNRNSRDAKNIHTSTASIEQTTEAKHNRRYGIVEAINSAVRQTPAGETLFVVPTYTGLLEIHRELEQRGLTPHYWEGQDK